jgi:hypothetical protein
MFATLLVTLVTVSESLSFWWAGFAQLVKPWTWHIMARKENYCCDAKG